MLASVRTKKKTRSIYHVTRGENGNKEWAARSIRIDQLQLKGAGEPERRRCKALGDVKKNRGTIYGRHEKGRAKGVYCGGKVVQRQPELWAHFKKTKLTKIAGKTRGRVGLKKRTTYAWEKNTHKWTRREQDRGLGEPREWP